MFNIRNSVRYPQCNNSKLEDMNVSWSWSWWLAAPLKLLHAHTRTVNESRDNICLRLVQSKLSYCECIRSHREYSVERTKAVVPSALLHFLPFQLFVRRVCVLTQLNTDTRTARNLSWQTVGWIEWETIDRGFSALVTTLDIRRYSLKFVITRSSEPFFLLETSQTSNQHQVNTKWWTFGYDHRIFCWPNR